MKTIASWMVAAGVAGTLFLAPTVWSETSVDREGEVLAASEEVSATVTKINHKKREVTLKTDDGIEFSLVVDDAVENLDQVSQGDVVIATYTEALAYEVIKGGEEAGLETTAGAAAAELGEMPGAIAGRSTTLMVTVTAIDTEAPSVTFMGPGGNTRTIEVLFPEKLDGVSVGDSVEITYAEALALSVKKAAK